MSGSYLGIIDSQYSVGRMYGRADKNPNCEYIWITNIAKTERRL